MEKNRGRAGTGLRSHFVRTLLSPRHRESLLGCGGSQELVPSEDCCDCQADKQGHLRVFIDHCGRDNREQHAGRNQDSQCVGSEGRAKWASSCRLWV